MFGLTIPKIYFVSRASTVALSPQPSIPCNVSSICALTAQQVSASYTKANLGSTWTFAVADNETDAQRIGLVDLTPTAGA